MFKTKLLPLLLLLCLYGLGTTVSFSQSAFYWIGGTGNWNDNTHWSFSSGGPAGTGVPGPTDTAYFDALSGAGTVSNLVMDSVAKFVATNSSVATFNISLRVTHSFSGPGGAATFGTSAKTLLLEYNGLTNLPFTPNTATYNSRIKLNETGLLLSSINLLGNLNATDSLIVINGTIDFGNFTINCGSFTSKKPTTDTRSISFNNAQFIVSKNQWIINQLTSVSRPKMVKYTGAMNGNFLDKVGLLSKYDSVVFTNASVVTIDSSVAISSLYLDIDSLKLRSSILVKFDTLYNPNSNCNSFLYIGTTAAPNGQIQYTGTNSTISFHHTFFNRISAQNTPTKTYTGQNVYQTNCTGITAGGFPKKFYWIGDGGNWSDSTHWSEASGGFQTCFYPKYNDTIVFDANSFSMTNQIVSLDTGFVVGKMLWTGIPAGSNTQFLLKDSLDMTGNLTMDQDVFVNSQFNSTLFTYPFVQFKKSSLVNLNACTFNANILVKTPQSDTVQLINDFVSSDSTSVYLHSGSLKTNNHKLHTQAIISFEGTQKKTLRFGSSLVELVDGWNTDTLDYYLNVDAGTSTIHVGRSQRANYFIVKNQVFNDVIFDFSPNVADTGIVKYNNTMRALTIKGGSTVEFNAGNQYTLDTLIIDGGCNKFNIDTVWSIVYNQDTTIDNSVTSTLVYNGSTNNPNDVLYGTFKLIPTVSFNDTTFIFGHKSTPTNADTIFLRDTLITIHNYANIPLYDTTGTSPNFVYWYNHTLTRYTRTIHYMLDSIGLEPLVSYGVDNTVNGNQAVNLFTSTGGSAFTFNTTNNQKIYGVKLKDIRITGSASNIAYFATNVSNNTGWTFSPLPPSVANFSTNGAYCFGDTVLLTNSSTSFSGNTNDLTYVWNFDETQLLGDTNQYVFHRPDTHIVSLTAYYTNSCFSKKIDTIFINKPVYSLNMSEVDTVICAGTSVEFTASSSYAGTQFQFYKNNTALYGAFTTLDSIVLTNISNLDTISVRALQNGCYSVDTTQYVFNVLALPNVLLTSNDPNDTICIGTNVVFYGDNANTYRFYKNSTPITSFTSIDSVTVTSLVDGDTIFVIGANSSGCRDTSAIRIIDVKPLPTVTLTSSATTICQNTSVTFTSSGAATYKFFVNGTLASSGTSATYITDSLNNGDVISVQGTSLYGCSSMSPNTVTMTVNANPMTQLICDDSDSTICAGTAVNFYASGAGTYEFFLNGTSLGAASGTNSITIDSLTNNEYVSVIGSFSGCTTPSDTIQFTVNALPTTTLSSSDADNIICQNTSVTFTGAGATNYQYFINGSSVTSSSTTPTFTSSTLANGAIVMVVGESNNCYVSSQITMTVNGIPNVSAISSDADNILCFGDPLTITGSGANSTYQISIDGTPSAPQASGVFTPSLAVGTHNIYLIGTSTNGCSNNSSNTFSITVNGIPSMTLTSNDADNTICAGQPVTFTGSGANLYQFYINGSSQTSNSPSNTFTTSSLTNGQTVTVRGTTSGCTGISTGLTFTVNAIPSMTVTSTDADNAFCQGSGVVYSATGPTSYQFFVDGNSQGAPSATNTFNASGLATGNHVLTITGTTTGCSTTSNQNITVNANPIVSMSSSDVDNTICTGQSVTLTGSGTTNYQFFQNGSAIGASTINATYTTSAIANGNSFYVIGSTTSGCTDTSATFTFVVNPNPTMTLVSSDADNIICAGDNVTFTAGGATSYEFFVNGTSQGSASATSTFSTTTLTNNSSLTVIGTALGCSSTSSAIVTNVNQIPVVTLNATNGTTLCSNQTATVTAGGANTYQLLINGNPQGAFTTNSVFNFTAANNDVITIAGQLNGCSSVSGNSITYNVTTNPTLSVVCNDADLIICKNDPITFNASGAGTYNFTLNGIPVQTGSNGAYANSNLSQGDIISITGYNSVCPSAAQNFTFTVNSMNLQISAVPSEIVCEGASVQFTATGGNTYEFFVNGVSQGPASATSTYTLSNAQAGTYVSFAANNTTTGCTQQLGYDFYPNVVPGVQVTTLTSTSFCNGDSVILYSNFPYGNQWYLDGIPIAGATDTAYVATQSGTYTVEHAAGGTGEIWSIGYNGSGTIGNSANIDSPNPLQATGITGITQISSGYDFAIALDNTGNVYAWGENGSGQLGNGTFTTTNEPAQIATLSNIQQIATTSSSCAALTSTGTVYVWGNNNYGQLGIGSFAIINFPFQIPALTNVAEIAGGQDHFIIRKTDGTVWVVGKNTFGQLGQGNLTNTTSFVQIPGLTGITSIGSAENHSFAINATGDLYLWGNNINGQLGLGDNTNRLSPTLSNIKHVKKADGGAVHSLVLTESNEVMAMGDNTFGQLGDPSVVGQTNYPILVSTVDGVKAISCGEYSSLVLRMDNQVYGSGYNAENQLNPAAGNLATFAAILGVDGVTSIEAGKRTTHYIYGNVGSCSSTGTAVTVFVPTQPTITQAGAVFTSSAAVTYQWYLNGQAIPSGNQQSYTAIATGDYHVVTTDANGCSSSSDTVYYFVLGLEEAKNLTLQYYPNPTSGVFTIDFSETIEAGVIQIADMTGRIIQTVEINEVNNLLIDLSNEANGTYLIRFGYNDYNTIVGRIVVAK